MLGLTLIHIISKRGSRLHQQTGSFWYMLIPIRSGRFKLTRAISSGLCCFSVNSCTFANINNGRTLLFEFSIVKGLIYTDRNVQLSIYDNESYALDQMNKLVFGCGKTYMCHFDRTKWCGQWCISWAPQYAAYTVCNFTSILSKWPLNNMV